MSILIRTLDIRFLDEPHVIANYLIESNEGLILIETGPVTAHNHLKEAIKAEGFDWKDVRHVFLTHIHFDHAGGAWKFAQNGAKIYVHPIGLPHLANPERLWNSAKRIYLDDMERLWGEMKPIDPQQLVAVGDGDKIEIGGVVIRAYYTPGHAIHHNAYQIDDIVFTGDVAGVKINQGPVVPPCPPPDIDISAWKNSIQKIKKLHPRKLYLAHFGTVTDVENHFNQLEHMLDDWSSWIKPHFEAQTPAMTITPQFVAYTQNQLRQFGVSEDDIARYEKGNPSFMSVSGLLRYWKLKSEGRL